MSFFLALPGGPKIYIELARWASPAGRFDLRRENGETLVWLGRIHLIYTPARWRPVPGGVIDGANFST
ncbi:MAG TPA: hypothetical protein VEB20_25825 [Azospirillaceae bacterium]|nr:hypothetical protein [Azospirillaceae bacterium]